VIKEIYFDLPEGEGGRFKTMAHGGEIFQVAERLGVSPREILDFSVNINPFFPLSLLKKRIRENLDLISSYPDLEQKRGRGNLANILGLPEDNILLGNGASELIFLILRIIKPKKVLIPIPTFSEYEKGAQAVGAKLTFLPLKEEKGFALEMRGLFPLLKDVDTLFLCNPNNPTGHLLAEKEIQELIKVTRKRGIWLILDEAFIDFVPEGERPYLLKEAVEVGGHLLLIRSLTKSLAIPGLRVGYAIAPKGFVERLESIRPPWYLNIFSQVVLDYLEEYFPLFQKGLERLSQEKVFFKRKLEEFPLLKVFPSWTNFFLCRVKGISSSDLKGRFLAYKILIRDCRDFRGLGEGFIRIAVRKKEDNLRLIRSMRKIFEEEGLWRD